MTITRLNHFRAAAGKTDELHAFLTEVVAGVAGTDGCLDCQLLRGVDDSAHFVVLERWTSIAAHQASTQDIDPAEIRRVMALLAAPPSGEYFES